LDNEILYAYYKKSISILWKPSFMVSIKHQDGLCVFRRTNHHCNTEQTSRMRRLWCQKWHCKFLHTNCICTNTKI